jgi:diguanylate cyclase (GGDEF)-like protein
VKDAVAVEGSRHYMAIIDVDNFKVINDTYGHLFGDKVILEIANILNSALNGRGIVSHFGGDEFLVFTDWIDTEIQVRSLLTYIRQRIRDTFSVGEHSCKITLSVGVSAFPEDGNEYYELFEKADKCLYLAKNKGRNRFIIYDEKKHGGVSVQGNVVAEVIDPIERAEQLAGTVAEAGIRLLKEGRENFPSMLEELRMGFRVDGIRIYSSTQGTPVYSCGAYPQELDLGVYVTEGKIRQYFEQKEYLVFTNFAHFKAVNRELYEFMAAGDIRGIICCYMPGKSGEGFYFFFDAIGRKIIWTESDKNYVLVLGRLMAEVL